MVRGILHRLVRAYAVKGGGVMAQTEYLPPPELHDLTHYKQAKAQAHWLQERAIPHRLDGRRVIVSREHVRGWLEGRTVATGGINFAAVR